MEYFWVDRDENFLSGVDIEPLTEEEIKGEKTVVRMITLSNTVEESVLADYITTRTTNNRYHIISDRFKNLCALYNKKMDWTPIVLIDQYKKCHTYWFWNMNVIDCISDKTEYKFDNTIKNLVINKKILGRNNNFIAETKLQQLVIIRLDLAESALRRGYIGFKLRKVLTTEVDND